MTIKISKELELPNDAITQTFAQIGRKGAGKTYLASMIAEQMLDIQAHVIVIDPIGNWWGLRVDGDGKSKGKDIFIIGGNHGDVPLASEGGKEIAKLLVEKNISVVLDISEFRKNERKRFVTDFAEEFYHLKKKNPTAVHIFLEESQKFVPQRVQKDDARMLGAWEDIVRLGRNCGIGCSLISQRPQSVNKEVLSQVECLCVLQLTGLHERKALEEWIQEAGEDRKLVGYLPGLQQGEGFVWSPSWLRIFKRVHFNKKTTFDTSATPKLGEATKSAKISKMDIEKLREQMTNVVEKISKEKLDRKILIDENNELKRQIRVLETSKPKPEIDEKSIERAKEQGFNEAHREFKGMSEKYERIINEYQRKGNKIIEIFGGDKEIPKLSFESIKFKPHINSKPHINIPQPKPLIREKVPTTDVNMGEEIRLKTGAIRMLKAIAMFSELTRAKTKTMSGISSQGTFSTYIQDLKRAEYIEEENGLLKVTEEGINKVGNIPEMPTDTESLINLWSKHIKSGAIRMLRITVERYPNTISRPELQEESGISSQGTFSTYIQDLKRNGLIKLEGSEVRCSDELFE